MDIDPFSDKDKDQDQNKDRDQDRDQDASTEKNASESKSKKRKLSNAKEIDAKKRAYDGANFKAMEYFKSLSEKANLAKQALPVISKQNVNVKNPKTIATPRPTPRSRVRINENANANANANATIATTSISPTLTPTLIPTTNTNTNTNIFNTIPGFGTIHNYMPARQKSHVPEFKEDDMLFKNLNAKDAYKYYWALTSIIRWINLRLIDKKFKKEIAGIYIWSYDTSLGKTLLCTVLSKIFKMYWWVFEDKGWQQDFNPTENYQCVVYNAINSSLLRFKQIEDHADRREIVITKRNQKQCDHIKPDTPFILTSNKPPERLGYEEKQCNMKVWKDRMLTVCVDDCPLFPLIDILIKMFKVVFKKEDDIGDAFPLGFYI